MAALTLAVPVSAQTNRIGGVVRDETGGTIRGAIVRAATGGTGTGGAPVSLTTATDDRGRFVFVISRSGEWRLTFEAPGFQSMTIPLAMRLTGPSPNLDIKLERQESPEAFGALAGVDSKSLSAQLAAAAALLDEGRYDQAMAAYRDIKARAPALTLVNLQIGNAHLAKKSYAEAEAAFQEILKSDAEDANGLFAMGALREAQGNMRRSAKLVSESGPRRRCLDQAADEAGGACNAPPAIARRRPPPDARHRSRPRVSRCSDRRPRC